MQKFTVLTASILLMEFGISARAAEVTFVCFDLVEPDWTELGNREFVRIVVKYVHYYFLFFSKPSDSLD
jgi:hypothetical protein